MLDFNQVKAESIGRWPAIFQNLGVEVGNGKHRACPICGGTDRFRFDDKDGRGTWFCNQCGAGDGVGLVEKVFNADFAGAMHRVADVIGCSDRETIKKQPDMKKRRRFLRKLWRESESATGSDLATRYLRGRGLFMAVQDVRFCPACYDSDTKQNMPAMLALVRNPAGRAVAIHRTYLNGTKKADIPSPKKLTPGLEPLAGCAIRLFEVGDHVGVAEGIETAIAANQLFGVPTWATISSTIMESFEPPAGVRRVTVFGDCDANFTGQAAALKLAKRLYQKDCIVDVKIPEKGDWADHG